MWPMLFSAAFMIIIRLRPGRVVRASPDESNRGVANGWFTMRERGRRHRDTEPTSAAPSGPWPDGMGSNLIAIRCLVMKVKGKVGVRVGVNVKGRSWCPRGIMPSLRYLVDRT